jgi:hypothetical protein
MGKSLYSLISREMYLYDLRGMNFLLIIAGGAVDEIDYLHLGVDIDYLPSWQPAK